MNFVSVLLLGFFLGMRHATDTDHVVAVTTIVSRERRVGAAAWVGALWGIGHTVTIMIVGGAILLFSLVIPARLGLTMEFTVALMLIALGAMNLTGAMRRIEEIAHEAKHKLNLDFGHPGASEGKSSGLSTPTLAKRGDRAGPTHIVRPLVVGLVHGLAGSAAVALLVLAAIRDVRWGLLYLGLFGVGTIAGMMLLTAAMSVPFAVAAKRSERLGQVMARLTGVLSIGFGIALAYQIGVVDGLFSSTPHWDPH